MSRFYEANLAQKKRRYSFPMVCYENRDRNPPTIVNPASDETPTFFDSPHNSGSLVESGQFPYWTLSQPVIYKLRPCCLDAFIPTSRELLQSQAHELSSRKNRRSLRKTAAEPLILQKKNENYYHAVKVSSVSTNVAYLFRGKKYLLVEEIQHPAKYFMKRATDDFETGYHMDLLFREDNEEDVEPMEAVQDNKGEIEAVKKESEKDVGLYELKPMEVFDTVPITTSSFIFKFQNKSKQDSDSPCSSTSTSSGSPLISSRQDHLEELSAASPGLSNSQEIPSSSPLPKLPSVSNRFKIPCECQIVRLKQFLHRELFTHHFYRAMEMIKTELNKKRLESKSGKTNVNKHNIIMGPQEKEVLPRFEEKPSFAESTLSLDFSRSSSSASLEFPLSTVYFNETISIASEQHAQDIVNELNELYARMEF